MKIEITPFQVPEKSTISLSECPTDVPPIYTSKGNYLALLEKQVTELSALQEKHYASSQFALLLIFQAMDAAGKDSTIRHVMSGVNPQGCQVYSFKHPSETELTHDFLWRTSRDFPERGRIGIFNRSYYEEVLIVRVHKEMLQHHGIKGDLEHPEKIWQDRYQSINNLEMHMHRNGTHIIKFFLHLSKEEQRQRFLARIDEQSKNWKLSAADIVERGYWDDYQHAYQECLRATSTDRAPWYLIPADDKKNARLLVAEVVLHTLRKLHLDYPTVSADQQVELQKIREQLLSEDSTVKTK